MIAAQKAPKKKSPSRAICQQHLLLDYAIVNWCEGKEAEGQQPQRGQSPVEEEDFFIVQPKRDETLC